MKMLVIMKKKSVNGILRHFETFLLRHFSKLFFQLVRIILRKKEKKKPYTHIFTFKHIP